MAFLLYASDYGSLDLMAEKMLCCRSGKCTVQSVGSRMPPQLMARCSDGADVAKDLGDQWGILQLLRGPNFVRHGSGPMVAAVFGSIEQNLATMCSWIHHSAKNCRSEM